MVPGSGRHSRLQDPIPSLLVYLPQSPPHSAPHPNVGPPQSVRYRDGPGTCRFRPQYGPADTSHSRLTSSAHPHSCCSVILAGVPTPVRTELVEKSPSLQASEVGALARGSAWVGQGKYYGGAGARLSGGSWALSKRDGAGLHRPRPFRPAMPRPLHPNCAPLL